MTTNQFKTADGATATDGARVFNFYDGEWCTVDSVGDDGWFSTTKDDGSRGAVLNGERVALVVPRSNPYFAKWEAGKDAPRAADAVPTATAWISLGRNRNDCDEPLNGSAWQAFKSNLDELIEAHDGITVCKVNGDSSWNGESEETALVLVTFPRANVPHVRLNLAALAYAYCQDGIGFVVQSGTDTYVAAS